MTSEQDQTGFSGGYFQVSLVCANCCDFPGSFELRRLLRRPGHCLKIRCSPARRWFAAAAASALTYLVVAVPTDLIDTRFFSREVPRTWWAYPALGITAVLTGLLVATLCGAFPGR